MVALVARVTSKFPSALQGNRQRPATTHKLASNYNLRRLLKIRQYKVGVEKTFCGEKEGNERGIDMNL